MKTALISLFLFLVLQTFANAQTLTVAMKAEGFHEIEIGTMLNPFSTTVSRAETKAKKNLRKKCKDELDGKIIYEIELELIRYDAGIMGALVEARGICETKNI